MGFSVLEEVQAIFITNTSSSGLVNVTMNGRSVVLSSLSNATVTQGVLESLFDAPCTSQQDSAIEFFGTLLLFQYRGWKQFAGVKPQVSFFIVCPLLWLLQTTKTSKQAWGPTIPLRAPPQ